MTKFLPILFWLMALINLTPLLGAVSPSKFKTLYGISPDNLELMTLLQHRAILLGLIGLLLLAASYREELRWSAVSLGVLSMGSFVLFAIVREQMNGPLGKIAITDIVGLIFAAFAAFIMFQNKG